MVWIPALGRLGEEVGSGVVVFTCCMYLFKHEGLCCRGMSISVAIMVFMV